MAEPSKGKVDPKLLELNAAGYLNGRVGRDALMQAAALAASLVSKVVNTFFIERHNGTDRNRNGRKARKTYCFSKDWQAHEAMTYFTMYSYNFCGPVRTLRVQVGAKAYQQRTPAMAAGLTDHVWTIREWATYPAFKRLRDVQHGL